MAKHRLAAQPTGGSASAHQDAIREYVASLSSIKAKEWERIDNIFYHRFENATKKARFYKKNPNWQIACERLNGTDPYGEWHDDFENLLPYDQIKSQPVISNAGMAIVFAHQIDRQTYDALVKPMRNAGASIWEYDQVTAVPADVPFGSTERHSRRNKYINEQHLGQFWVLDKVLNSSPSAPISEFAAKGNGLALKLRQSLPVVSAGTERHLTKGAKILVASVVGLGMLPFAYAGVARIMFRGNSQQSVSVASDQDPVRSISQPAAKNSPSFDTLNSGVPQPEDASPIGTAGAPQENSDSQTEDAQLYLTDQTASTDIGSDPSLDFATTKLNLRAEPNCTAPIRGKIPEGAAVQVTGEDVGGWYPIAFDGVSGWASGHYLVGPSITYDPGMLCEAGNTANARTASIEAYCNSLAADWAEEYPGGRLNTEDCKTNPSAWGFPG